MVIFGMHDVDLQKYKEHRKWACVSKQWHEINEQWKSTVLDSARIFQESVLPSISIGEDLECLADTVRIYFWDYNIVNECVMVAWRRTKNHPVREKSLEINESQVVPKDLTIYDDEIISSRYFLFDGIIHSEAELEELEIIAKKQDDVWMFDENFMNIYDLSLDSAYSGCRDDQKNYFFETSVHEDNLVSLYPLGYRIDKETRWGYTTLLSAFTDTISLDYKGCDNSNLKIAYLKCLSNLAGFKQVRKYMKSLSFLSGIMSATRSISVKSQMLHGINVLMAVCHDDQKTKQKIVDHGGFLFVNDMYRKCSNSKYVVFDLCVLVYELCIKKRLTDSVRMVDINIIDFLCSISQLYLNSERFIHNVCKTIHTVCTKNENKMLFLKNGGFEISKAMQLMYPENSQIQNYLRIIITPV